VLLDLLSCHQVVNTVTHIRGFSLDARVLLMYLVLQAIAIFFQLLFFGSEGVCKVFLGAIDECFHILILFGNLFFKFLM
jgi:hypothetical protein